MSIGFFTEGDAAVTWRGPMLHRALEQFLSDVHWGELDYLIVDMPPGTGDVSISLGQLLPSPDLLLVTTPQPAAQRVAARAAEAASKTGMHVAGVIENMSHLVCACCGEITRPFGEGGGERAGRRSWACRCWARSRWTSRCGSPPTPARRWSCPIPQAASAAAILELAGRVPARCARRAAPRRSASRSRCARRRFYV